MSFLNFLVGEAPLEMFEDCRGSGFTTAPFFNGRERGFVLIWNPEVGSLLNHRAWAFVEGRNHDGLVCWSWELGKNDHLNRFWIPEDVPNADEVYENRKEWDNGNFGEALSWLSTEFVILHGKQKEESVG